MQAGDEITPIDVDRYGRTVAHVHYDGIHANWKQVEDGLAWCFARDLEQPDVCLALEKAAKRPTRGCGESRTRSRLGSQGRQ